MRKRKEKQDKKTKVYMISLDQIVEETNEERAIQIFKDNIKHGRYTDEDIAIVFDDAFSKMFSNEQ